MKIKYLGTAAAEAIPGMFCVCEKCREAKKRGGKNIRTRTQVIIDDELLIDFPADTFYHMMKYDIDLEKIDNCIISHTHSDHLYTGDLCCLIPGYSVLTKKRPFITFHGSDGAMRYLNSKVGEISINARQTIGIESIEPYKPKKIGNHTVTAMKAVHDPGAYPLIYIIENSEGKKILYAHDTGYFCSEVWEFIEKNGVKFDYVSLDCTNANDPVMYYDAHMNLNDNIRVMNRLKEMGAADNATVFCSNHFSHNGKDVLYEDFSEIAKKAGILTSYDGMEVEF